MSTKNSTASVHDEPVRCMNTPNCFECRGDFEITLFPNTPAPHKSIKGFTVVGNCLILSSARVQKAPFRDCILIILASGEKIALPENDVVCIVERNGRGVYR